MVDRDPAIMFITAWLVSNVGVAIVEYRVTVADSEHWDNMRAEAHSAITVGSIQAISLALILYTAAAVTVGLLTGTMSDNAHYIVFGVSDLLASLLIFGLSLKIPKWLGVYYSAGKPRGAMGRTVKELQFNIRWSIGRHFGKMFFISTVFFCGVEASTIPFSTMLGGIVGSLIYFGVYFARTRFKKYKTKLAKIMAVLMIIISALNAGSACSYIQEVWGQNSEEQNLRVFGYSFLAWLAFATAVHVFMNWISKRRFAVLANMDESEVRCFASHRYKTEFFRPVRGEASSRSKQTGGDDTDNDGGEEQPRIEDSHASGDSDEQPHDDNEVGREATGDMAHVEPDEVDEEERDQGQTTCDFIKMRCCSRRLGSRDCQKTKYEKAVTAVKWLIYVVSSVASLYFTIVNIGASQQTEAVLAKLPSTYALLYPPDYLTHNVCAWDNEGPNSTIKTYETTESALSDGLEVVHCGPCGACSTWNDLSLQWSTREFLAARAQGCAKKSFGGGKSAVQRCNEEVIGFSEACATCWTDDILCAKRNCVFIYLQGVIINTVSKFDVGPDDITSATCDEAMCGPEFVPCSGATRRRMNIVSDIPRPVNQQCTAAKGDYSRIFNHP